MIDRSLGLCRHPASIVLPGLQWSMPWTMPSVAPFLIAAAQAAVFDGDWKLIEFSDGTTSLFQLSQDPGESRDLNRERLDIAARLQNMLAEWKQQFPMVQPRQRPGRRPVPQ